MKGLNLDDLNPVAAVIEIEIGGETKRYDVRKFNLLAQMWVRKEFGTEAAWQQAMDPTSELNRGQDQLPYLEALCKTMHHLLVDKTDFPTWEDFALAVGTGQTEQLNLGKAMLTVMGLSQAVTDQAVAAGKKKIKQVMGAKKRAGTK